MGAGEILLTSMDRDGTKSGFDNELSPGGLRTGERACHRLRTAQAPWTTSADAITDGQADAVLAASLFHFGELRINQVKDHMAQKPASRFDTKTRQTCNGSAPNTS